MELTYKTTNDFTSPAEARALGFSVTQKQKSFRLSILLESDFAKMYTLRKKISKDNNVEPTEFEESIAQVVFDLENTNQELKSDLNDLYINSAIQVDVSGSKKAVVIHVPYRLRKAYRKIHVRLVRELEKKFSGKDVFLIATRRIVRPPKKGSAAQRPRSRTLIDVHEAMLEDVVLPTEIIGKRIRYRLDGSKIMKVQAGELPCCLPKAFRK